MPPSCSALDATCSFQFNERLGILMNVFSSTFSTAASGGLLVYITVRRRKSFGLRRSEDDLDGNGLILLISLLVADLIQAIGGMQSARWLLDARLTEGPLCTFQSVFLNIGEVAIALSALSIALHTFCVLVLGWRFTRLTLRTIAAGIWCLTALIIGISNRGRKHYYGDTGYWCWITEDYLPERITASYLWMWITFFSLIILYFFMFLVMRGIVTMKRDRDENEAAGQGEEEESLSTRVAYQMLFYPAVYLVCIAPISVSRWIDGGHPTHSSPAAVLGGHTLFTLSGVFNTILFSFTRPTLVKGDTETRDDSGDTEMQQQRLSEDARKMEQDLPAHRHVPMESNRALGTIASWDSAESPVLEPNPLPRLQATLSITREAQSGPHGHGRLPD